MVIRLFINDDRSKNKDRISEKSTSEAKYLKGLYQRKLKTIKYGIIDSTTSHTMEKCITAEKSKRPDMTQYIVKYIVKNDHGL